MSDNQNNMDDDFETEDFDLDGFDDGGFDDMDDQKGTLGDLWRNNPLVKIGVIAVGVLILIGGIIIFGGDGEETATSRMASARDVSEAPGTSEVSETFRQAVEEENVRRTEESIRNQGSAIPTPIDPPKGTIDIQIDDAEEEDPLERWRRLQEERIRQQQVTETDPAAPPPEPEPVVDTRTPAVNALSAAMAQQMGSILGGQEINGPNVISVSSADYLELQREAEAAAQQEAAQPFDENGNITDQNDEALNILLPAGTIEYAQLITEANTDAPGPILAEIVSGPLKGARIIGSFEAQRRFLTLNFNTIVLDGVDFSADAIAIDPDTTLPGVITDVNNRYFQRIILPGAAAFVEGFTEAIAESGRTSITISGAAITETTETDDLSEDQEIASGIEEAGEEIGEILDEIADDVEPLLRVRAGTPIGVFFISSVTGTPQIIEQREANEFERERLLRLPFNNDDSSN